MYVSHDLTIPMYEKVITNTHETMLEKVQCDLLTLFSSVEILTGTKLVFFAVFPMREKNQFNFLSGAE